MTAAVLLAPPPESLDLTLASFRRWLSSLPNERIVGSPSTDFETRCGTCPIAIFLRETWHPGAEVTDLEVVLAGRRYDLPDWAITFVEAADRGSGVNTVGECIQILHGISIHGIHGTSTKRGDL